MSEKALTARLTEAFSGTCRGEIHSVFTRTANAKMALTVGPRLLTLTEVRAPAVPDSICVPEGTIVELTPGMPIRLSPAELLLCGTAYPLQRDPAWDGHVRLHTRWQGKAEFLRLTASLPCGLDALPPRRREEALNALCTPDAPKYFGLGCGLTPSFDDACVGVMAVYRAAGLPAPFAVGDLSMTTDVSARYLRLANEGYFGQALKDLIEAVASGRNIGACIRAVAAVGATSGSDMLMGMRQAFIAALPEHHMNLSEEDAL